MDIIFISNQVKYDILNICGLPAEQSYNLLGNTPLHLIGYGQDKTLCRKLENKLQLIANEYNTGREISYGTVSEHLTVRQCIQLVIV